MKTLILILMLATTGCATIGKGLDTLADNDPQSKMVWDIKDQAKFTEDWNRCTSLAVAYSQGDDFRDQCMVVKGQLVKNQ